MKKFLLTATALVAIGATPLANAADMPVKAPVYTKAPPLAYNWTGFYIGLNGGYSFGNSSTDYTTAALAFSTSQSMDGWVFGGQAGYNWQVNQSWLIGIEADIQATGQDGTATDPSVVVGPVCPFSFNAPTCHTTTTTGSFEQKLPWLGTARLRLGVLPSDHWLLYATGGLAVGEVETNATVNTSTVFTGLVTGTVAAATAASSNTTRVGWTLGGGVEWALWDQWTAKLEYLYVDLGTIGNTITGLGAFSLLTTSSHVTDNIVRVGVNYRFGGSPVVAKY
jgi:outer membrane immunogenic protein